MGGFGECLETRVRQLWHYNTTFGSLGFNIAAIQINVLQLIVTAVLLGIWHSKATIEYIWWPAFECVRIFVLTMCRADVLLKDISDIRSNSRASSQTRRIIMLCNLIGAASIIIGAPIFLLLLPMTNDTMYWTFIIVFIILIIARIGLTIPMFSALIYGYSMYRIIDGNNYERIDDGVDRQYGTHPLLSSSDVPGQPVYDVPEHVLIALQEERAMARAMEESRRERDRNIREQQDREYQEALDAQKKLDEVRALDDTIVTQQSSIDNINNNLDELQTAANTMNRQHSSMSSASLSSNSLMGDSLNDELAIEQEKAEAAQAIIAALPPLGEEPAKSSNTVSVRIRLPNGKRCIRRFDYKCTIKDVKNWVNHELVNNDNAEIINEFQLVTTIPRTIYNDNSKNLKDLKFWRENAKRECHTPFLYVEEKLVGQDYSSDEDDDNDGNTKKDETYKDENEDDNHSTATGNSGDTKNDDNAQITL